MKIAIIGTGAMGSIYAARFSKAGHEVVAIDIWKDHVDCINRDGLLIEGPDGEIIAKNIKASTKILDLEGCDFCIIATKALSLEESIKNLKEKIDLNVPIKNLKIEDDTRIKIIEPFLKKLIKDNAKVILLSHLGRPKGKTVAELSMKPIFDYLKDKLDNKIFF